MQLICNYGLFWERKYIDFGRGKNHPGHLKGYVNNKRIADFREQIGVYVLHDKDLVAVYVGQAGSGKNRLLSRLGAHTIDHLWNRWEHFSWFGIRRVNQNGSLSEHDTSNKIFKIDGIALLNQIEGVLISVTETKLNKQGARWGKDVEQYFQEQIGDKDPVQREDLEELQKQIFKRIDALDRKRKNKK